MPEVLTQRLIGTLNERPLHASLKEWYSEPGDVLEAPVDGYQIDIVRGDLLIEIQTGGFTPLKRKLWKLTESHDVRLVCPVAVDKWIVKLPKKRRGKETRRKSPKHGGLEHVFVELVSFPKLLSCPRFSLEVLLIREEEVRRFDGKKGWRKRGWVTEERRLIDVVESRLFDSPAAMCELIPDGLQEPFPTSDLAEAIGHPRWVAQKMAYCLREMGAIAPVGKDGNSILYVRSRETD